MSDAKSSSLDNDPAPDDSVQSEGIDIVADSVVEPVDLQAELDEANDRLLRSQAELENFRKRTYRDMEDQRRYASLPLIRDLLSVLDNLHRAIEAAQQSETTSGLLDGVKMVAEQFDVVLKTHHCNRIEAVGAAFDPNLHEALAQQPSDDHPANTVMMQARVGYMLHDRVVRPSQVFVSSGPPTMEEETPSGPDQPNDS